MIDVLIPAKNEAETIGPLVQSLKASPYVAKVIVVINGSTDCTAHEAREQGASVIYSNVTGKGQAVGFGLPFVRTIRTLLCDGDLSPIPVAYVNRLASVYSGERMLIGSPDFTPNVPWAKPGALWTSLSGVRTLPTRLLYELKDEGLLFGYTLEVMINNIARNEGIPIRSFRLHGVKGVARFNDERVAAIREEKLWLHVRGIDYERLGRSGADRT